MDPQNARDRPQRRQAERFRVALPVQLETGTGTTRDASASGVYFETDQSLSLGAQISFSLMFGGLRVECEGQVVRVEPLDRKVGVAVALTTFRFEYQEQA